MANLTVSIPDSTKTWIEEQVRRGTYASVDDYLASLVQRDQQRDPNYQMSLEELQKMLEDSRQSGISPYTTTEIFEQARAEAARRRTGL